MDLRKRRRYCPMKNESRIITNENAQDKSRVSYIRCSSVDQNESRQFSLLEPYGAYKTFFEKASAKDTNRPMLAAMLDYVRTGDTVYTESFSRIARNTQDLLSIVDGLEKRGVKLISLKESLDTSTPTGKLMLTMIGAISTFEREQLLERQREGIAIAKSEGKFKGRKAVERPPQWTEVYNLYMTRQISANAAIERLELKRNTFYKFVGEEKDGGGNDQKKTAAG
jgi:DNA invertase Pin-like site-specific DNA recombinase